MAIRNGKRGSQGERALRIAITGANGQLGTELKNLSGKWPWEFHFYTRKELDITEETQVKSVMSDKNFDFVINCAAYTQVDLAEKEAEKAYAVNVVGVANLARICSLQNSTLIHISTDYVYNGHHNQPYEERARTGPKSIYGTSKLAGEKLARQLCQQTIILRTSWLYSSFGNNFFNTMRTLGEKKDELRVVFDQVSTPTYGRQIADAIYQMINKLDKEYFEDQIYGVYHIGNEGVASWYDFATEIMRACKLKCQVAPITSSEYPTPAARPAYSVLNKKKFTTTFGITLPHWRQGLEACVDAARG